MFELDLTIDETLPAWLQDTDRHINCPNVPIVYVLKLDKTILRPMAFVGTVRETGAIVVSMPKLYGHSPSVHVIAQDRIAPKLTKTNCFPSLV